MVKAMETASGRKIPYVVGPRRPGDLGSCYSIPEKAKAELGWEAKKNLQDMCTDAWRWQSQNPRRLLPSAARRATRRNRPA